MWKIIELYEQEIKEAVEQVRQEAKAEYRQDMKKYIIEYLIKNTENEQSIVSFLNLTKKILNLNFYPDLSKEDKEEIIDALIEFYSK